MRTVTVSATALQGCTQIGVILAQLKSPFASKPRELDLKTGHGDSWFEWSGDAAAKRAQRFKAILNELRQENFVGKSYPTLIVFPEYTVPKIAHSELQAFSDSTNSIVIPGSYYEDDKDSKLYKNNVCQIFLPHQKPVTIVKRNGFDEEQKALAVAPNMPNAVHLGGNNPKLHDFSISVFICKDYLVPYQVSKSGQRTLAVDSKLPGINIVSMCSPQTTLFESLAALDLRELRGRRRLTALCNCANMTLEGPVQTGSALLGPREDTKAFEGDVIRRLKSTQEGFIVADISLDSDDLCIMPKKPSGGAPTFVPVRYAAGYELSDSANTGQVQVKQITGSAIAKRGVWHPAFLEKLNLKIAIQLVRSKDLVEVRQAIDNKGISSLSAYVVEGMSDLVFRYYEAAGAALHLDDAPYNMMSKEQFNELFFDDKRLLEVFPKDIIKYRTVELALHHDPAEWENIKNQIDDILPDKVGNDRRRSMMQCITKLSRDWNDPSVTEEVRQVLAPVFLQEREVVPPTSAYQPGRSNIRQVFTLISMSSKHDVNTEMRTNFENEVIKRRLMPLAEVRSIYRIRPIHLENATFEYWLDMVAEQWKLQEIILQMDKWGHELKMTVGSRTMGVLDYLLLESVEGVSATDNAAVIHQFIAGCKQLAPNILHPISRAGSIWPAFKFLNVCSQSWQDQRVAFRPSDAKKLRAYIGEFYVYLFLGNLTTDTQIKTECLHRAGHAWNSLFQACEASFESVLERHFGITPDIKKDELWTRSTTHLKSLGVPEATLAHVQRNAVQKVFLLAQYDESFRATLTGDLGRDASVYNSKIAPLRNRITHAAGELDALAAYEGPDKEARVAEDLAKTTASLIDLVNFATDYLRKS